MKDCDEDAVLSTLRLRLRVGGPWGRSTMDTAELGLDMVGHRTSSTEGTRILHVATRVLVNGGENADGAKKVQSAVSWLNLQSFSGVWEGA